MPNYEILIPKPIGEVYYHRTRNGKFCMEHHETKWTDTGLAHCPSCGRMAKAIDIEVDHFLKIESLRNGLIDYEPRVELYSGEY